MVMWTQQAGAKTVRLLALEGRNMYYEYSYSDHGMSTRLLTSYSEPLRAGEKAWYSVEGPLGSSRGPVGFAKVLSSTA